MLFCVSGETNGGGPRLPGSKRQLSGVRGGWLRGAPPGLRGPPPQLSHATPAAPAGLPAPVLPAPLPPPAQPAAPAAPRVPDGPLRGAIRPAPLQPARAQAQGGGPESHARGK